MLKGRLLMLAVLAAAFFLKKRELDRRGLPEPWIAAAEGSWLGRAQGAARPAPSAAET